ncbi:estrogen sulfotransferase [Trichogramma pretiosum]|uniref:estrogen sulfotransferase n=1 Tax=Trichogramma pretiosum TaxID=7493 RepID=UPI0006C98E5B|nr:estrogen sulfotransferase [Trichogramma pretiosum]
MTQPKMPDYRPLDDATTEEMLRDFTGERTGWVQVGPEKWFFPHRYTEQGQGFYNFKARPDDTWVLSYPRSGTTWTQELVWLVANDLDFETAKSRLLAERFPFLEFSMFNHPELTEEFLERNAGHEARQALVRAVTIPGYEVLDKMPGPRFIKSHFPFSLLPNILESGAKMVYVARNPKDVAVSWYNLNKAFKTQGYQGDFAKFWRYFRDDLTPWSPYWKHLNQAWSNRNHKNVLFIFYEQMQTDLAGVIRKVADFLGKSYNAEQIQRLVEHLDVKSFRDNPMINGQELKDCGIIRPEAEFVRKGKSGGWRDHFAPELEAEANDWIKRNLVDFEFPLSNNNWL